MHRYDKYIYYVILSIFYVFKYHNLCCIIDIGSSQLRISVQDSSDHAVVDIDSCYPISTIFCNLRSAWFVCNSLCQQHDDDDDDDASGLSPSVCVIKLLHQSSISMNLIYGSLELNYKKVK